MKNISLWISTECILVPFRTLSMVLICKRYSLYLPFFFSQLVYERSDWDSTTFRWMYFCLACLVCPVFLREAGWGGDQFLAWVPGTDREKHWLFGTGPHRIEHVSTSTSDADPFRSRQESDEAVKGTGAGVLWRSTPQQSHLFLHGLRSQRDKVPLVSFTNSVLIAWEVECGG